MLLWEQMTWDQSSRKSRRAVGKGFLEKETLNLSPEWKLAKQQCIEDYLWNPWVGETKEAVVLRCTFLTLL